MSAGSASPQAPRASFLGSLKDALAAASRDDTLNPPKAAAAQPQSPSSPPPLPQAAKPADADAAAGEPDANARRDGVPSAAEAAREARGPAASLASRPTEPDAPPTTRVMRGPSAKAPEAAPRTQLVRGKVQVKRGAFEADPVAGWLVVVGGPGIGQFRPIFEGNNTIGRGPANRVPLAFGDESISTEEQAYIRYDSAERSFLFVPNLAKTNVVSVNDKRPTGAVELQPMDVITMGHTQLAFVPFCSAEFDWSAISGDRD